MSEVTTLSVLNLFLLADATSRQRLGLGRNVKKEHIGPREGRETEEHLELYEKWEHSGQGIKE